MSSFHLIKQWLAWKIGNGNQAILVKDPFIGDNSSFKLSTPLIQSLNTKGIYSISQDVDPITLNNTQYWLNSNHLNLTGDMSIKWNNYIKVLKSSGVSLNQSNDKIVWSWNRACGSVSTNLAYQFIVINSHNGDYKWSFKPIWKVKIPRKIICFMWLCLKYSILIGENYKKRGDIGLVVCSLCLQDDETIEHLIIHCEVTQNIWK
jgi:hypothetical protein